MLFHHYLGDLTVNIDTSFPIERLMLAGFYDRASCQTIKALVRPGDVCVDVGANIGALTLLMAKLVGSTGMVIAVEPGPMTYARLRANLAHNPALAQRVQAVQVGLSDRPGVLYWHEDPAAPGNASLAASGETRVEVTTFDDLVARHCPDARIRFIKIDVEGMELEVIRGAMNAIRTHRPVVLYESIEEFRQRRGFDVFAEIRQLFLGLDYQFYGRDASGVIHPLVDLPALPNDTIAVPLERVALLGVSPVSAADAYAPA